jgi:hypothetical protein
MKTIIFILSIIMAAIPLTMIVIIPIFILLAMAKLI